MDTPRTLTDDLLGEVVFVHRLARALVRDAGLAHDVAQNALAASLHERPPTHLRGWLAAVVRRLASRARRDAHRRAEREARRAAPEADDREQRTHERLQLHRRLTDAVLALPEPYRTAVTLRFFDGLPPRAIAKRLGVPPAAARQQVRRGLAMLRQRLDREFGCRGAWCSAFATAGLGDAALSTLALAPMLAMKKLAAVVVFAALATLWWSWPSGAVAPGAASSSIAPAPVASSPVVDEGAALRARREPADGAEERAAGLRFVVVVSDERERPIAGAWVHRWTTSGELQSLRTVRDGRAEFAAREGGGGVCVLANGHAPLLCERAALHGELRCTLPDGAVLAGQVLVDETPAPAGLRIGLEVDVAVPAAAPRAIHELLAPSRVSRAIAALTAPGGAFAFRGLAPEGRATLVLPTTHWFVADDVGGAPERDDPTRRTLPVSRDLVLRTTRLPSVFGNVVWADDGAPVASPRLMVYARFADGTNTPSMGCQGHDDGTFAAGLHPSSSSARLRWLDATKRAAIASVELDVDADGSDGSAHVELDAAALAAMPVEVRLRRAPITHFVATDREQRPIAGARVSAAASEATDAAGRGTFRGRRDGVLVGAEGYQVQPATPVRDAAGTAAEPLHFELALRNQLEVRVQGGSSAAPPIRFVRIESPGDLFCGRRFQREFDRTFGGGEADCTRTGKNQPDGSIAWREWSCTVVPEANGRLVLHSLEPGLVCTARAIAAFDEVVAESSFTTPAPGAVCSLDLVVARRAFTLRGRVQERDGAPIADAVVVAMRGGKEASARTNGAGVFVLDGVYGDQPCVLLVKAPGFAAVRREVRPGANVDEPAFVLERGHRVTLRVVDEAGQLVPMFARPEGVADARSSVQTLQRGEYVFDDLPGGVLTFAGVLGGHRVAVEHDTTNPAAVLRVPRPGRVVVSVAGVHEPVDAADGRLAVRAARRDAPGEVAWLRVDGRDGDADLLIPGVYDVALVWRADQGESADRVMGTVRESVVRAGELTRVTF